MFTVDRQFIKGLLGLRCEDFGLGVQVDPRELQYWKAPQSIRKLCCKEQSLLQGHEEMHLKILCKGSIIHWSQKVKTTPMSNNCYMNKQKAIRIPLNNKRIKVLIHTTSWINFKTLFLVKKGQMQKTTYCMIAFVWNIQKRQIYKDRQEINSCLRLEDRMRINCKQS